MPRPGEVVPGHPDAPAASRSVAGRYPCVQGFCLWTGPRQTPVLHPRYSVAGVLLDGWVSKGCSTWRPSQLGTSAHLAHPRAFDQSSPTMMPASPHSQEPWLVLLLSCHQCGARLMMCKTLLDRIDK